MSDDTKYIEGVSLVVQVTAVLGKPADREKFPEKLTKAIENVVNMPGFNEQCLDCDQIEVTITFKHVTH